MTRPYKEYIKGYIIPYIYFSGGRFCGVHL